MTKPNTIYFVLIIALFSSCQQTASRTIEQERFDRVLHQSSLSVPQEGTYGFILWGESSCSGCKKTSAALLRVAHSSRIRLIVPPSDKSLLQTVDTPFVYIDSTRLFQKYYIGVSNVGFIILKNGETVSIKDYNSNAIPLLEKDLAKFLNSK